MTDMASIPDLGTLQCQWLLGDWTGLAALRDDALLAKGKSSKTLVLLALVGCQQVGLYDEADALARHALDQGHTRDEVARWMLASLVNTLARASAAAGLPAPSLAAYRQSIMLAPGSIDSTELAQARAAYQARLMALERAEQLFSHEPDSATANESQFEKPAEGITSYAQNMEDVMLWRAVGTVTNGFYIDIGAQDPIVDSVSRAFYEKGWRGIHVEPAPTYAAKLRDNRPDELVLQVAIGDTAGEIEFYEFPNTGISTGDAALAQDHRQRGFEVQEIRVSTLSLADVFALADRTDIHWLKIDVEGMEKKVLEGWGDFAVRPWIIVIESILPFTETLCHNEWESLLLERSYQYVYFDGLNRFYISEERQYLKGAFTAGPNIFDHFRLGGQASSTFHRLK